MTQRPVPDGGADDSTDKRKSIDDSIASGETLARAEGGNSGEQLPPLLEGRYQFDEKDSTALLGRGGQGTVWRAYDKVLRREVALKRLHSAAVNDPAVVSSFLREARLTALLEHPGIVPLHDVGREADGSLYLALRRIEGKSLADTLAAASGLDGRLALVPALVRACHAVAFAHEHGVVHRDLKPQNIMLGRFGETYVLDWGLALLETRAGSAHITGALEMTGVVGTPAYMSPEQAQGLAADARSDVWGLGACLHHLLAGQPPIAGRSLKSAIGHASAGEVSPVLAVEPRAPADLAAICEKALSFERELRYPNASALAADLEAWLAGRTVSARTYKLGELLRRAVMANRRVVAVVSVGVLVLGAVLGFDELRIRRERNEARTFVRELMRELPHQVDASRANIELINTLTSRSHQWLGRSDLSIEEMEEACEVLSVLAGINTDTSAVSAARDLYTRATVLGQRGLALQPSNPLFFACELEGRSGLAYCESEMGDRDRAGKLYEEAWARMQSWKGEVPPKLHLARSELATQWGTWAWVRDPALARKLYVFAAEEVLPMIDSPLPEIRQNSLRRGSNAAMAIWSEGRLEEAVALSRRFYEAAALECREQTLVAQRTCYVPVASYSSMAGYVNAPDAEEARTKALAVESFLYAHDVDSVAGFYDAVLTYLEEGFYVEANSRAHALRLSESASWGKELGPLSAVLAGDLAEVDAWAPHMEGVETGGLLAKGLREAAEGRYAEAARHLRGVKKDRLWYDIAWAAHPKPKLELPVAARPAFERFLTEFTKAYGAADMKGLGAAIDELATSFDRLPLPAQRGEGRGEGLQPSEASTPSRRAR